MQSALKLVLENPDNKTADLIATAQKQYDGEYYVVFSSTLHHTRSHTYYPRTDNSMLLTHIFLTFAELPGTEKLHDLLSLMALDETQLEKEWPAGDIVKEYQQIIDMHFSSENVGILPPEMIQQMMVGVSCDCLVYSIS